MNFETMLGYIKSQIMNSSVSFDYFEKCISLLNYLIGIEHFKTALAFARNLEDAKVILETSKEEELYAIYQTKLQEIDRDLENKLQVKNVKVR